MRTIFSLFMVLKQSYFSRNYFTINVSLNFCDVQSKHLLLILYSRPISKIYVDIDSLKLHNFEYEYKEQFRM
jgi:hypothetical protein